MRIQKCNACKISFSNKPWINTCPVCKSKNINHNEDGSLFEWNKFPSPSGVSHFLIKETEIREREQEIGFRPLPGYLIS